MNPIALTDVGAAIVQALNYVTAKPVEIAGVPHVILPAGVKVESRAELLEREKPLRIRREVHAHDVRGLVEYVNTFKSDATKLYCGPVSDPEILARIDDHDVADPSHVTHLARFDCPTTDEWDAWSTRNRTHMTQLAFAEFLEMNSRDIRQPAAADLLQLVTNFSDARSADFSSAMRLQDGQVQLSYVVKDAPGKVVIPEKFQLALPVFQGGAKAYLVDARLRYRLKESQLAIWYELDRPDLVKRTAYDDLLALVTEKTGLAVFRAM